MSSILEKKDGTVVVTVRLTLKPDSDGTLIDLVRAAPHRKLAKMIKEAMRNGVSTCNFEIGTDCKKSEIDLSVLGGDI